MLDTYCNFLNSPAVQGNLRVQRGASSLTILQGDTANQFSQTYYRYALAKVKNRQHLPKDFARVLERHNYFGKLKRFLERDPRPGMSLSERLISEQTDYELGYIWHAAFNETLLLRMNRKFPEFHKLPDNMVPLELNLENRRMRRDFVSEISRALWRDTEEWKKVEAEFARLRESFVAMISRLDIPDEVRTDWLDRIRSVRLAMPGALPAISNEECSTVKANAYYHTYLDVVTVCAGDFNSEDIAQSLAHEMAHALGIDRAQYLFEIRSEFGRKLAEFRAVSCRAKGFSCELWTDYKEKFPASLRSLEGFSPQLPSFQGCLKKRPTTRAITNDDVDRIASSLVADRISELASSERFLRITKAQMPLRNGKSQRNPNYMNPCSYYMWTQGEEPIDDELTTLIYFTAEYRCMDDATPASHRMKAAIETAKGMSEEVLRRSLRVEGEFSARSQMENEGLSSPPFERFADVIGGYALADLLSRVKDIGARRDRFLASSSWQCTEPSLESQFPEESSIEKEYIFDSHTQGDHRKKELFSKPIRRALACQKDFDFKECSLPFLEAQK